MSSATEEKTEVNNESVPVTKTLLLEKFKAAVKAAREVQIVDQNPKDTNKFYYVTDGRNSLGIAIWEYDAANDPSYISTKGETLDVAVASRVLLDYKVKNPNNIIFRVGLSGNNYVFFEMDGDYSPGPCAEPEFWLDNGKPNTPKLLAIDVTAKKPIVRSYVVTKEDKIKATAALKQCVAELNAK